MCRREITIEKLKDLLVEVNRYNDMLRMSLLTPVIMITFDGYVKAFAVGDAM